AHSGTYELDLDAPANLRARLDRLHARLAEQSADRSERDRVIAEIAVAERALDEAERALAPAIAPPGAQAESPGSGRAAG
ncbi:MAG TPA: hypothetical protein VGM91_17070, partial [Conexibacter sp.]